MQTDTRLHINPNTTVFTVKIRTARGFLRIIIQLDPLVVNQGSLHNIVDYTSIYTLFSVTSIKDFGQNPISPLEVIKCASGSESFNQKSSN